MVSGQSPLTPSCISEAMTALAASRSPMKRVSLLGISPVDSSPQGAGADQVMRMEDSRLNTKAV